MKRYNWAGVYKILLRRRGQYRRTIQALREQTPTNTLSNRGGQLISGALGAQVYPGVRI
jgi:hypothetical protein